MKSTSLQSPKQPINKGVNNMGPKKAGILTLTIIALVTVLALSGKLLETNNAGFYQVKQAAGSGTMTVKSDAGLYWQGLGDITTYKLSDEYYFSKEDSEGSDIEEPIKVRFNDGGTALISGVIKFRLSNVEKDQLLLHSEFRSYEAVKHALIRQVVTEAVQQTANLMKAEESYSTRRSQFAALAEEQVKQGIFETIANVQKNKDADNNEFIDTSVELKLENGKPVVRKESPLPRYNIEVVQFVIKDMDFDETIEALISKKKEAEQQKVVARANAERAKQDTITAREQGEAKIAVAKAEKDVEKIEAVTAAQKEFEVAKFARLQAEEEAKAKIVQGQAEAQINRLKVQAGLTPQERADYHMKTAIGVAEKLSQVKFPGMMIIGGDSGKSGQALNPFDAVGLESFMRINDKLADTKQE